MSSSSEKCVLKRKRPEASDESLGFDSKRNRVAEEEQHVTAETEPRKRNQVEGTVTDEEDDLKGGDPTESAELHRIRRIHNWLRLKCGVSYTAIVGDQFLGDPENYPLEVREAMCYVLTFRMFVPQFMSLEDAESKYSGLDIMENNTPQFQSVYMNVFGKLLHVGNEEDGDRSVRHGTQDANSEDEVDVTHWTPFMCFFKRLVEEKFGFPMREAIPSELDRLVEDDDDDTMDVIEIPESELPSQDSEGLEGIETLMYSSTADKSSAQLVEIESTTMGRDSSVKQSNDSLDLKPCMYVQPQGNGVPSPSPAGAGPGASDGGSSSTPAVVETLQVKRKPKKVSVVSVSPLPQATGDSRHQPMVTASTVSMPSNEGGSMNTVFAASIKPREYMDPLSATIKEMEFRLSRHGALADPKSYIGKGEDKYCLDEFLDDSELMQDLGVPSSYLDQVSESESEEWVHRHREDETGPAGDSENIPTEGGMSIRPGVNDIKKLIMEIEEEAADFIRDIEDSYEGTMSRFAFDNFSEAESEDELMDEDTPTDDNSSVNQDTVAQDAAPMFDGTDGVLIDVTHMDDLEMDTMLGRDVFCLNPSNWKQLVTQQLCTVSEFAQLWFMVYEAKCLSIKSVAKLISNVQKISDVRISKIKADKLRKLRLLLLLESCNGVISVLSALSKSCPSVQSGKTLSPPASSSINTTDSQLAKVCESLGVATSDVALLAPSLVKNTFSKKFIEISTNEITVFLDGYFSFVDTSEMSDSMDFRKSVESSLRLYLNRQLSEHCLRTYYETEDSVIREVSALLASPSDDMFSRETEEFLDSLDTWTDSYRTTKKIKQASKNTAADAPASVVETAKSDQTPPVPTFSLLEGFGKCIVEFVQTFNCRKNILRRLLDEGYTDLASTCLSREFVSFMYLREKETKASWAGKSKHECEKCLSTSWSQRFAGIVLGVLLEESCRRNIVGTSKKLQCCLSEKRVQLNISHWLEETLKVFRKSDRSFSMYERRPVRVFKSGPSNMEKKTDTEKKPSGTKTAGTTVQSTLLSQMSRGSSLASGTEKRRSATATAGDGSSMICSDDEKTGQQVEMGSTTPSRKKGDSFDVSKRSPSDTVSKRKSNSSSVSKSSPSNVINLDSKTVTKK